ncbi:DUF1120 domain-containing protein [Pseudomonas sp. REP124]|uniref:DUF1120 domain-containing protein n=1 Tax=Pseudomonas sp. REP124 TaxID=2875731 RepID=UPI001CCFB785|nr:DUF1120 domain-containing protein [Pseudomonas sp. REP124]MBZ9781434.1 DUF1120 domain-containing protein [Pseudomonas sp. REP124]
MKNYLAVLSTTALISFAPYALAASSTDLSVTGTITPSACAVSLSGGGSIDIGKVSAKDLKPTSSTQVGVNPLQLTMTCDSATLVALKSIDNKEGTATEDVYFGLGLTNAGEKLGFSMLAINQTTADAQVAQAIGSTDGGATWDRARVVNKTLLLSVGTAADPGTPIQVKDVLMDMEVHTFIARADSLTLTDEVTIDGSATIEVKYL